LALPPRFPIERRSRGSRSRQALIEVDSQGQLAGDTVQKLVRFYNIEVVEPQLVAGGGHGADRAPFEKLGEAAACRAVTGSNCSLVP
jgi:hypothetical protein